MTIGTDVIIIGAGPAGLTAARRLEELEVSYTLVSRDSTPGIDKACGGYVPGRAIEEFNLGEIHGSVPIDSIRMKFPGFELKEVRFEQSVGVNVSREDLGKALLDKVPQKTGEIWLDTECNWIETSKDSCKIRYTKENVSGTLSCQVVIDASGANPASLRSSNVRERPQNDQLGYGVQYQMKCQESMSGTNDFFYGSEFSPRGYAWNFPRHRETVVGTGGLVNKVRESERRAFDYLDHLVNDVEPINNELETAGAEIVRKEAALMPLAGIVSPSYGNRILLAGDAACHCSPISGEGIHYSMVGGLKAAETAATCVKKNEFSDKALSHYEQEWTKAFGSDLKWGLWLQKRFLESGSSSMGSAFLKSEKSMRVIAEMLAGARTVRSAILAAAPGYLLSKIRRV
ncbi:MAG: geranylgeranyl reductase family protein [Candidatus Thorarchaeota archaeon]|jgi:digeranylgeranylglycerophospholipid reductase